MSDAERNVKVVFGEALECATPAELAAYLDRACGGDTALRDRVEALLRAHQRAGHFLQGTDPPDRGPAEAAGTALGPYRLLEPLGEGGFGIVYRAEQTQPVRRHVALKVLRPGMDGRQVIARFEAERQALALMDHANIARVLDAGEAAPDYPGAPPRPYFVMELVEGVPLTDFCDQEHLTPRERLELFGSVCRAVQHAHQKGIIHRDLKPSNVLVSRQDGVPVVKVIDFGIAKALDQRLTDKTLVTGEAQVIGTPLYMSPEQAEPGAADIDTRSDIYALGVLLYELLTGTTPFDRERLRQASFDELRRILREEEPPRPSTRLSTLGPAALTLSEQRRTDPKQLGRLLRGELDWVVMKCLEKDRSRRYQTADALARDVARYLADEPVEACPPSAGYRLGKFLRKHRRPLATAAAFLVLLAAAGVLAGWQVVREARAERDRAVEQAQREGAVHDALGRALALREEARQMRDRSKWARAREQAQRALALVESGPTEKALAAQVRQVQEELDEEEQDRTLLLALEKARLAKGETVSGENRFAPERAVPLVREALRAYGMPPGEGDPRAAAARIGRRSAEVREALLGALDDWLVWGTGSGVAEPHADWLRAVLLAAEPPDGWGWRLLAATSEVDLAKRRAALEKLAAAADGEKLPTRYLELLYSGLRSVGAQATALRLLRRARQEYPGDFWVNHQLGTALQVVTPPDWEEAVRFLTVAAALRPDSPGCHLNLGNALAKRGRTDEAVACYQKAIALDSNYAQAHLNLVSLRINLGQFAEAIAGCRQTLARAPKAPWAHQQLGMALDANGQSAEAIASYRQALELDPRYVLAHFSLGNALQGQGRLDEAIPSYQRALELDPKLAVAHLNLGVALGGKGRADEALACFRRALDLDPRLAEAHANQGSVLADEGQLDEAIACFRRALELDPKPAGVHLNLGQALQANGRADEALACFRRALELDPKLAAAHYNLGWVLGDKGRVDEAIACYRRALELDPQYAEAHCNLGDCLRLQGKFRAALASVRTGHELGSRQPGWSYDSDKWVKELERCVQLDDLLTATREGKARPAGPAESVELADFCRNEKHCPAAAVRFYTEAFTAEPKLAADLQAAHRYRAAQAAALAGCGQGDGANLDAAERARLRRQALQWLRADLDLWTRDLKTASPQAGQAVGARMQQWLNEPSLAAVRDQSALAGLPAEERPLWQAFWADVAAARTRAAAAQKPAEK
jgi:tetratricopeptide (TPR) repeat protein